MTDGDLPTIGANDDLGLETSAVNPSAWRRTYEDVPGIVSVHWLSRVLEDEYDPYHANLVVVDASWYHEVPFKVPRDMWQEKRIPGAQFYDMSESDDTSLPHMLPSAEKFAERLAVMGIGANTDVIVYDTAGIFSAPRCALDVEMRIHQEWDKSREFSSVCYSHNSHSIGRCVSTAFLLLAQLLVDAARLWARTLRRAGRRTARVGQGWVSDRDGCAHPYLA